MINFEIIFGINVNHLSKKKSENVVKEKFEKQVIKGNVTVNFLDESEKEEMSDLAKKLKEQSKYKTSSQ